MKNWKKAILPATLALAVMIPAAAYAAETGQSGESATESKPAVRAFHKGPHMAMFGDNVHHDTYLLLLAEKYTPESVNDWQAAIDERNELLESMKPETVEFSDGAKNHFRVSFADKLPEELKAKLDELKQKAETGEISREEMREQLRAIMEEAGIEWKRADEGRVNVKNESGEASGEQTSESPAPLKFGFKPGKHHMIYHFSNERQALHDEFTAAVKSEDAEQIKEVLPKMLEDLKQQNEELQKQIDAKEEAEASESE